MERASDGRCDVDVLQIVERLDVVELDDSAVSERQHQTDAASRHALDLRAAAHLPRRLTTERPDTHTPRPDQGGYHPLLRQHDEEHDDIVTTSTATAQKA